MLQPLWRLLGPGFGSSASGQQLRGRGGWEEPAGRGAQLLRAPVPSPSLAASSTGAAPPCSSGAPCRPGQQQPTPHTLIPPDPRTLRGPRATAVQRSCALTSCAGFCPSIHISPRHLWGAKYVRGPAELGEEVAREGSKQPRNSQFISLGL